MVRAIVRWQTRSGNRGLFYSEDENGQRLKRTQKGLAELREIMDEELWQKYLETVLTKTSARCKPENRALAQRSEFMKMR